MSLCYGFIPLLGEHLSAYFGLYVDALLPSLTGVKFFLCGDVNTCLCLKSLLSLSNQHPCTGAAMVVFIVMTI